MAKPVYLILAAARDNTVAPIGIFTTKLKATKFAVENEPAFKKEGCGIRVFETKLNEGLLPDWEMGDYAKVFKHIPHKVFEYIPLDK